MRDLNSFVNHVVSGQLPVNYGGTAVERIITVQLNHSMAAVYSFGTIHLYFVIILCFKAGKNENKESG